jgi:hypothetical protein
MKFDTSSFTDQSAFACLLIHAMGRVSLEKYPEEMGDVTKLFYPEGLGPESTIDVKVSVNGVDINPKFFLEALAYGAEERIKWHAQEIVQEQVQGVINKLEDLKKVVGFHMDEVALAMPKDAWYTAYLKKKLESGEEF